ncbi:MAG: transglycosylase domain-containing protein [Oscillospiraceae bacterium]|nr:transglycosylase domain-containing protein [Oscillospiraceae bacterium]
MAEESNKRRKVVPQSWKPHRALRAVGKVWSVVLAGLKIAAGALATVLIICVICGVVFLGLLGDYLQDDIVPIAGVDLDGFNLDQNSFVYYVNSDGNIELLQALHATNKSVWAELDEIPEALINATIAIEDKRFYEHQGVDWVTTIKACSRMFFGNDSMGGSTITQQLIKNLFDEKDVTVQRKVLEIFRATEFEKRYDKDVVLEWYFNMIYMGNRCTGVKTAAATYFGKELQTLTVAECASLISITNNPSLYNPYRLNLDNGGLNGEERNRVRQLNVLDQMLEQDMITQAEYDEAVAQKLVFKSGIAPEDSWAECQNDGCDYGGTVKTYTKKNNQYYCPKCGKQTAVAADASQEVYSYFVDTVIEDIGQTLAERDGVAWNDKTKETYKNLIQSSGYHIYTTLDMDVQNQLDKIYQDLKQIPKPTGGQQLQSAMVVLSNATGDIVALSGGVGKDKVHDGLNRATDSDLQTGSSGKPLMVYAPAFETGAITPATVIKDLPNNYNTQDQSGWPKNDDRIYRYSRTIHSGIVRSVNAVAANTLQKIGTGYAYRFAKEDFRISGLTDKFIGSNGKVMSDIGLAPLALGAQTHGVSVRDMASGFGTFANNGTWREGRTFTKVYDRDGNLVLDNIQESDKVLNEKSVGYINYCLGDAVAGGTGWEAKITGQTVYGKTGTTASNRDRWFCGYTKYYTAAVWCGYDQPAQIIISGNPAAQLFKKVMQPVHQGLENAPLVDTTKDMKQIEICLDSGKLATDACRADIRTGGGFSRTEKVFVYEEDIPMTTCDKHVVVDYCTVGGAVANEYCKHYTENGQSVITQKSLVKLTQAETDELLKAEKFGLEARYLQDSYVYLVDKKGAGIAFKGFHNDKNVGINAPYVVCTVHGQPAEGARIAASPSVSANAMPGITVPGK